MLTVQFMKPFYTKISGTKMRIVFAYQYFSIIKDDEVYHFIPIEAKEMVVDLNTLQIENLSDVFVFQRGNRFIRLPLYQLMLISNVREHLHDIVKNKNTYNVKDAEENTGDDDIEKEIEPEVVELLEVLEQKNIELAIDKSLKERDRVMFYKLIGMLF